jgi:hypothetical protein
VQQVGAEVSRDVWAITSNIFCEEDFKTSANGLAKKGQVAQGMRYESDLRRIQKRIGQRSLLNAKTTKLADVMVELERSQRVFKQALLEGRLECSSSRSRHRQRSSAP